MHADRFDAVVLSLDSAVSRRGSLVGGLSTGLAVLLTRLGVDTAEGKKRKRKKKKCKGDTRKCGKTCIPKTECCSDTDCPPEAPCQDGTCICPNEGEVACGKQCVDLLTDGTNCGACGHGCKAGECVHGACTCFGADDCPGDCVCSPREQGGSACSLGFVDSTCDTDEDCPIGSICGAIVEFCTKPCLG